MYYSLFPRKGSKWRTVAVVSLAAVIGIGVFMAYEARFFSYLSDDPQSCVNCHVMTPVYNSWMHSSHRAWASCNDCHVPQDKVLNKYYFKAKDGLYHASVFTLRAEPEVMFLRDESAKVVQDNCLRCHTQQISRSVNPVHEELKLASIGDRNCWSCHRYVPHGRVHGTSTVKYNISPTPQSIQGHTIPDWLKKEIELKTN